ncbi:hypothetical protein OG723_28640 [Streptomyces sp. NBC_01278]|nr:hypothetical protein [Streptomyces sp. NBC_01278]
MPAITSTTGAASADLVHYSDDGKPASVADAKYKAESPTIGPTRSLC